MVDAWTWVLSHTCPLSQWPSSSNYMHCSPGRAIVTTDTRFMFPLQVTNKEVKLRGWRPKWKEWIKFITLSCSFRTALGTSWGETQVRVLEWTVWTSSSQSEYTRIASSERATSLYRKSSEAHSSVSIKDLPSTRSPSLPALLLEAQGGKTVICSVGRGGRWAEAAISTLAARENHLGKFSQSPSHPPPPPPGWTLEQLHLNPWGWTPESSNL